MNGDKLENRRKSLYLYLDEDGNYNFNESGSSYFIMTCVEMRRPFSEVHARLLDIKYDCIEIGLDLDRFHASDDQQKPAMVFIEF